MKLNGGCIVEILAHAPNGGLTIEEIIESLKLMYYGPEFNITYNDVYWHLNNGPIYDKISKTKHPYRKDKYVLLK